MTVISSLLLMILMPITAAAEKLKYERIVLNLRWGWYIRASPNRDIKIGYGAGDSALVMKELYNYEQLHQDVVDFLENRLPKYKNDPQVSMFLVPEGYQEGVSKQLVFQKYPAARLWNELMEKLLPALFVGYTEAETFNSLQQGRYSPFIPITGEEKFPVFDFKFHPIPHRKDRIHQIMLSLTPEQRVALGHPAEYPVNTVEKDNKRRTAPPRKTVEDGGEKRHVVSGKKHPGRKGATEGKSPLSHWFWIALIVVFTGGASWYVKRKPG